MTNYLKSNLCSDVIIPIPKGCEPLKQSITRIEIKVDDDGGLFARINGKGKWKYCELDEKTMKLTISL